VAKQLKDGCKLSSWEDEESFLTTGGVNADVDLEDGYELNSEDEDKSLAWVSQPGPNY
jgi:hypothetical protein